MQNDKWRVETCNAGRAGAHRPSKALHGNTAVGRLTAAPRGSASLPAPHVRERVETSDADASERIGHPRRCREASERPGTRVQ